MHTMRIGRNGYACGNVAQMNEMLIDNWNSAIGEKDFVVVLGDFVWKDSNFAEIFKALHGKKILVKGNHDTRKSYNSDLWLDVQDILRLRLGEESNSPKAQRAEIYCSHYPLRSWNKFFHGSFHAYGHTHSDDMRDRREFNVGVDISIDAWKPKRVDKILSAVQHNWFPKRDYEPLPDFDPEIMRRNAENYLLPFDMRKYLEDMKEFSEKPDQDNILSM